MPKHEIPPGCVLIRITDLAALLAALPQQPRPVPAGPKPSHQPEDAWDGLGAAIAMLTAHLGRHDVDLGELAEGTDATSIIRPLVIMAGAGLRAGFKDQAGEFLRSMGAIAATRGRGRDGELL